MKIPGNIIATALQESLAEKVKILQSHGVTPTLATILIGDSEDQLSYVSKKQSIAQKIGAHFNFIQLPQSTSPQELKNLLTELNNDPKTTGIIVQQPLPTNFKGINIYDFIPAHKEIEAHMPGSPFIPAIAKAVATVLTYIIKSQTIFLFEPSQIKALQEFLYNKKVVIVGRGITGGAPIMRTFTAWNIPYTIVHSQTSDPSKIFQEADIIITAVGKKVLSAQEIKKEAILINAGLRKEDGKLRGDYHDEEIHEIASFYTPTPGGLGPVDVTYLFANLIEAAELQLSKK